VVTEATLCSKSKVKVNVECNESPDDSLQHPESLDDTTFRKLDLFPSSGDGKKTAVPLGALKRANLNPRIRTRDKVQWPGDPE
jgi:hypothetical protein